MKQGSEELPAEFAEAEASNTQVLGVTVDGFFANKAWTEQLGTNFPMLSDLGSNVTRRYGIFNPQNNAARRATFLIDKTGKIVEIQLDQEALDSANAVNACERHKLKG